MKRKVIFWAVLALVLGGCGDGSLERKVDRAAVSDTGKTENGTGESSGKTEPGQDATALPGEDAAQAEEDAALEDQAQAGDAKQAEELEQGKSDEQGEDAERAETAEQGENVADHTPKEAPQLPETGRQLTDFVPFGWELWDSVELDFNGDGVSDYVGVLQAVMTDEDGYQIYRLEYPRILFAIASDKAEVYRLDFQDENVIRKRDEGGIYGDPYLPLTAEGTSFTTHTYGGSAWRWSEDYTYTYREGEWWLTSSEKTYGYGDYITDYEKNDWESGVGIRKERSSDWGPMEKNFEQVENGDWESIGYDLEYEVPLDAKITLEQAGKRWWLAPDRVSDWEVRKIVFAEDVDIPEDKVEHPEKAYIDYCDENCVLYTFTLDPDTDQSVSCLAMYSLQDKTLSVLAEGESDIDDLCFYDGKIYYSSEIVENVAYRTVEDGKEQVIREESTVGIRLNRMESDGSDKEMIFEYLCVDNTSEILESRPRYVSIIYEISGGEIVAEVHLGGEPHPFYRMQTDGSGLERIGQVNTNNH